MEHERYFSILSFKYNWLHVQTKTRNQTKAEIKPKQKSNMLTANNCFSGASYYTLCISSCLFDSLKLLPILRNINNTEKLQYIG